MWDTVPFSRIPAIFAVNVQITHKNTQTVRIKCNKVLNTAFCPPYLCANHGCCTVQCSCFPTLTRTSCYQHWAGFSLPLDQFCMNWHCHSPRTVNSAEFKFSANSSFMTSVSVTNYSWARDLRNAHGHIYPAQQGFLIHKFLLVHWDLLSFSI